MTDIKRIGDSGIHTVEGNVAGSRAARLTKQRDAQQAQYEAVKNKIKEQNSAIVGRIDDKFNTGNDMLEQEFKRRTIGLVSSEDFRQARLLINDTAKEENDRKAQEEERLRQEQRKKDREALRKKKAAALSFDDDDGECGVDDVLVLPKKRKMKDPTVETAFLPDRERDQAMDAEKERLKQEWIATQEEVKKEMLEVVYSYWDGSGHRKAIQIRKGTTTGRFLELVKQQLMPEFSEMRLMSSDSLLYVKEDLIIPHHISFYDLIVTKARGKSGPLFHFDVHDDIRLINDARIEKDESHPGKVVERRWYERNKHIFPASRWEVYDPTVKRDEGYTIHGGEVAEKAP